MHGETGEDSHEARPQQTSINEAIAERSSLQETMCDSACIMQAEWKGVSCVRSLGGGCLGVGSHCVAEVNLKRYSI